MAILEEKRAFFMMDNVVVKLILHMFTKGLKSNDRAINTQC